MKIKSHVFHVVLFASLSIFLLSSSVYAESGWARVSRVIGNVKMRLSKDGAWKKVRRNQTIPPGAQIKTSAKSSVRIKTNEKHQVRLSPRTTIQLEEKTTERTTFKVLIGKMRSIVRKLRRRQRFRVKTPIAVASVRGTDFDTTVKEDKESIFDVAKGHVGVKDLEEIGKEVSVFKNQSSTVRPGQAASPPEAINDNRRGTLRNRRAINKTKQMARIEARREIGLQKFKEFLQADVAHEQRTAEYQDGKTIIDAFGKRVRIEEYFVRPQPNQISFVTINSRENVVSFSRYDAFAKSALPANITAISSLFRQSGTAGNKPSNYIERQKWFTSNGGDIYREWTEGGDMIFFTELGSGASKLTNVWNVVFTDWYVEIKGKSASNFRLVSHWVPDPSFANGSVGTTTSENILTDGALDRPDGYNNYESAGDVGTAVGDNRPIDSTSFADRLLNANIFGSAAYQDSEGYDRTSEAEFDGKKFADQANNVAKLALLTNAKTSSALHTYKDSDGVTTVTTLRVDQINIDDLGNRLSLNDRTRLNVSIDSINFEQVASSPDFTDNIDIVLTPRIFRQAGLIE